eukprot:688385-Pleurochrysis_carterae.AAC.1
MESFRLLLHCALFQTTPTTAMVPSGFAEKWVNRGRCAGGVRALTLDRASLTSAADVMPWLDLACVAIQSIYCLARIGLTVKDPVGGLGLWWQSIPFVLPEPLVSPKHVDEELWSRTCPYYLAEVAHFNWVSQ